MPQPQIYRETAEEEDLVLVIGYVCALYLG